MSFKDMIAADIHNVFLNATEFAERRSVIYDETEYPNIPVVFSGLKESDRTQPASDHAQGLYLVSHVMHLAADDIGGVIPEKGTRIKVKSAAGTYYETYYVAGVQEADGMLRIELETIAE